MRLRILDACVIEFGSQEITPSATHFFALLLRLGADAGRHFQRHELAELLFPSAPSARAGLHSARQIIYQAAQRGVAFERVSGAVGISAGSVSIDLDEALARDQGIDRRTYRTLSVLPGYAPHVSPAFDDWLDAFREHATSRLKHSLLDSLEVLRKRADWRAVEVRAKECLTLDPFSEPATLALAEALARTGSKERAVATLEVYRSEVGSRDAQIAVPAALLRKRIEIGERRSTYDAAVPLIGRGDEIAALHDQSAKASAGAVQFTLIRGEPGSGKSRLIDEFQSMTAYAGASSIALVRKTVADRFRPFALFADLVPMMLRLPGAAGCDPTLLPFLTRLTDAVSSQEALSPGEADYLSAGITRAIVDLLDSLSNERPCVILIDDSRAIDEVSLVVLRDLVHLRSPLRVHFAIACADSEQRDGMARLQTRTLTLKPLPLDSARELLTAGISATGRIVAADRLDWCLSVAAGNPAFLLLLVAHCVASSALPAIPLDIVTAVDTRLALLPPDTRRTLEACTVLGDDCDPLTVAEVLGVPPMNLIRALDELERGGFVELVGDRILLRSRLFRDRVLGSASAAVLSLLHGLSALALESRSEPETFWRIAHHWRSAGQYQKARTTLTASWRRAVQLGQPRHAEASVREYLALTVDSSERAALYDELIEVVQAADDYRAVVVAIDERAALLRSTNTVDLRSDELAFDRMEAQLRDHSDPSRPEDDLMRCMRSPTLDTQRKLRAALHLIISADATANAALANTVYRELGYFQTKDSIDRASLHLALLIYHVVFGSKTDASEIATQVLSEAKREASSWPHIRGRLSAAIALQMLGRARVAFDDLAEWFPALLATGAIRTCVQVASRIAIIALDEGEIAIAHNWAARARSHAEGVDRRLPTDYLSVQADLCFLSQDFAEARNMLAMMREAETIYEAPRYKMDLLAYALRLAHFDGSALEESAVDTLLEWHMRARAYGRHDDIMDSLWVSLVSLGRGALASTLLIEYLCNYRREDGRCGYFLRSRTATDPAWLAAGPVLGDTVDPSSLTR